MNYSKSAKITKNLVFFKRHKLFIIYAILASDINSLTCKFIEIL